MRVVKTMKGWPLWGRLASAAGVLFFLLGVLANVETLRPYWEPLIYNDEPTSVGAGAQQTEEQTAAPEAPPEANPADREAATVVSVRPDCDFCPSFVQIPPGNFTMGSPSTEEGRFKSEGPTQDVTIPKAIAVGTHEVTKVEFREFAQATGHTTNGKCWTTERGVTAERSGRDWRYPGFGQNENHPVVCVNWYDAQSYLSWLTEKTGESYRLPSEAEWEYAARAGTQSAYYWGDDAAARCRYANLRGL